MNRIKSFLRLRRQNDDVKIATIYVVIAIYCFVSSVITGINFNRIQSSKVSYEFITMHTKDIEDIVNENNNILGGTLQKIITVQFEVGGTWYDMECRRVSKDYLQNEIGVQNIQQNVFYANSKAIQMMFKEQSSRYVRYTFLDDGEESNSYTGQFVEIESKSNSDMKQGATPNYMDESMPSIYCYGTVGELQDSTECIIKIRNHDIDGTIMKYLSENGFQLKESQLINEEKAILNETLLKIKYRIIIAVICSVSVCICYKRKLG